MPETLTLLEFATQIGDAIHSSPRLRNVWITAELSDVQVKGGHLYAELIQKDTANQTIARMRANLWATAHFKLRQKFLARRQEELRTGLKVRIQGSASHHNVYGLSFNITDIDPEYVDEGDILRRRMEILQQMKNEGIFEANKSLDLAPDAHRIAIISAEGAAGLGDFLNQLRNNPEGFKFDFKLFPSPMQGAGTPGGIISQLQVIFSQLDRWDCVVIIRGGGATADMNCFDDISLARNICYFPLPVIVGIGHERDNCVLDYIANTRCVTPTAVAEFLIGHQRQAWQAVYDKAAEIVKFTRMYLDGEKQRMAQLEAAFPATANQNLERERLRLKNFATSIPLAVGGFATREHTRLEGLRSSLEQSLSTAVSRASDKLASMSKLVDVLSPVNTLRRGYSITRVDGKAVRDASKVPPCSLIETQLASGKIISRTE